MGIRGNDEAQAMKVNALELVGAIIGAIAIFSTWITVGFLFWDREMNLLNVINETGASSDWWFPSLLFVIGTVIAFVSPIGGFLQLVGAPWFMIVFTQHADGRIPSGIGPYLGLASAVVVLASMARPIGPGLMTGPFDIESRLVVFSGAKKAPSVMPQRTMPFAPGATNFCPYCGVDISPGSVRCPKCGRGLSSEKT